MAEFEITESMEPGEWDRFVEHSPQGTVFASNGFLATLDVSYRRFMLRENGVPVLALPLLFRGDAPLRAPYGFCIYQGPMFSAAIEAEANHRRLPHRLKIMEFLLAELADRWPLISFALHPKFDDLRAIQWFNYHQPEKGQFALKLFYTGRLALDAGMSESACLQEIRTVRRQEFRKAEQLGFTLEASQDVALLDQLHELTFQRQGMTRPEDEVRMLHVIASAALQQGFGYCFVARAPGGEAASAILFLHDHDTAYYLFGANDPQFRKTGAGTWLLCKAIDHARRSGRRNVDFVGINSPNRGDFKTSFNAEAIPYFHVNWNGNSAPGAQPQGAI